MNRNRRSTDRTPTEEPPWWIALVLLVIALLPILFGTLDGKI